MNTRRGKATQREQDLIAYIRRAEAGTMWTWEVLRFVVPIVSGGILVALAGATGAVRSAGGWWPIVVAAALGASLWSIHLMSRGQNPMYRDEVAAAAMAILCSAIVGVGARKRRASNPLIRLALAAAIIVVCGVLVPFVALIAHCTSGDCL